ncbi:MAG: type II toxin-antitoxin system VapC family toxin [Gammaproteobacteria bacterium]|nr:type II toxin-antitoxin system VapC family toxin [Gammaproteobacteria bacterium]
MSIVYASSAVLAILLDEPGARRAAETLDHGVLSAVNASEVVARLIDQGAKDDDAGGALQGLDLAIRPFDESLAVAAGLLRRSTRRRGLSLGDRACLALALRERAPVLTADRAWTELELDVEVELIR